MTRIPTQQMKAEIKFETITTIFVICSWLLRIFHVFYALLSNKKQKKRPNKEMTDMSLTANLYKKHVFLRIFSIFAYFC